MSTVPNKCTVAISHMRSTNDKKHNEQQVREIVQVAKDRKASVSLLLLISNSQNVHIVVFSSFSFLNAVIMLVEIASKH